MVANATATVTAEKKSSLEQALEKLIELVNKQPKETGVVIQRRIQAHIRETLGLNVNIAMVIANPTINEDDKKNLIRTVWMAVSQNKWDLLKGEVAVGDKNLEGGTGPAQAPAPPSRTTTVPKVQTPKAEVKPAPKPTPKAPAPATPRAVAPAEPSGDDDSKIVTIINNVLASKSGEWRTSMLEVVKHAMSNGQFPEDRVRQIIHAELEGRPIPTPGAEPAAMQAINAAFVPDENPDYIISDEHAKLMDDYNQQAIEEGYVNVQLVGPHGCGKTEFAMQMAARYKRPVLIVDCANLRERRDWFGHYEVTNGTLRWIESEFIRCVKAGNHVIVWDEVNRLAPDLLNPMMPLWDWRRATLVEEARERIVMGKNTICVATCNEGYQYVGTAERDPAQADRWTDRLELTYLPPEKEETLLQTKTGIDAVTAKRLVDLANNVRQKAVGNGASFSKSISTRMLLAASRRFRTMGVAGLTPTIINHFSPEPVENSERNAIAQMVQGKFGTV